MNSQNVEFEIGGIQAQIRKHGTRYMAFYEEDMVCVGTSYSGAVNLFKEYCKEKGLIVELGGKIFTSKQQIRDHVNKIKRFYFEKYQLVDEDFEVVRDLLAHHPFYNEKAEGLVRYIECKNHPKWNVAVFFVTSQKTEVIGVNKALAEIRLKK